MKMRHETLQEEDNIKAERMHMSLELSDSRQKLALSDGNNRRFIKIRAGKLEQLQEEIEKAKVRFGPGDNLIAEFCTKLA